MPEYWLVDPDKEEAEFYRRGSNSLPRGAFIIAVPHLYLRKTIREFVMEALAYLDETGLL